MPAPITVPAPHAFIDGASVGARSGATFETMMPATGEVLAEVAACGPDDVDRAVTAAGRAFRAGTWSRLAPAERKAIMLRFADGIAANLGELARLDAVDAGKPISDCENLDLPDVINTIRWFAEAPDKVFGKISPTGTDTLGLITHEPLGVVGAGSTSFGSQKVAL